MFNNLLKFICEELELGIELQAPDMSVNISMLSFTHERART
jgi:hypothetical protein